MLSPLEYYDQKKEHYSRLLAETIKDSDRIAVGRLCAALAAIIAGVRAFHNVGSWHWWFTAAMAALFLFLVRVHSRLADKKKMLQLHLSVIEHELQALQGDYSAFPDGGIYIDVKHPYSYDLDIFGKGSIYQSLCRTVTVGGGLLLANKLAHLKLEKDAITGRQEIIKELSLQPDLLQDFRVAGMGIPEGPDDQIYLTGWLQAQDHFINNSFIRVAAVLMPTLLTAALLSSVFINGMYPGLSFLIIVNWILLLIFQKNIKLSAAQIDNTAKFIDKYECLLKHMAAPGFQNRWLQNTSANAKRSLDNITALRKIVHLFESRSNAMVGMLMNTLFLFDFYCLLRLETWRRKHKQSLLSAMDAVIEMDVYVSCGIYAFNHPENIYADIVPGTEIRAKDLRHPLLSPATAIGNDFDLGVREQFYLLTGANMTGKSTFIRTVGISNVFCNIGLPLPAKELSMPLLQMYTSMRITDALQDDISYFRAELNRIRNIMDKVGTSQQPYLVLLDEPLRGTNSTDKQQGTRAIIDTLLTCNVIGIVATHDTGLCDMEVKRSGKVSNYHFESRVEQSNLSFDFLIKPGGSTSNNATILMRQMGIIH